MKLQNQDLESRRRKSMVKMKLRLRMIQIVEAIKIKDKGVDKEDDRVAKMVVGIMSEGVEEDREEMDKMTKLKKKKISRERWELKRVEENKQRIMQIII